MLKKKSALIFLLFILLQSFGQKHIINFPTEPMDSLTSYLLVNKDLLDFYPSLFPFNSSFTISSDYGHRKNPVDGEDQFHSGIDFRCPKGTDVISVANGRIIKIVTNDELIGNSVTISHLNGWRTSYSHLDKIYVAVDTIVSKGEIIGQTGSSGKVTGSHLHYTVSYKKKPLDPLPFCYLDTFIRKY